MLCQYAVYTSYPYAAIRIHSRTNTEMADTNHDTATSQLLLVERERESMMVLF